jgi:hypothetical protein
VKNVDTEQMKQRIAELENELKKAKRKKANVFGATGKKEKERGTWCTPKNWAEAVGPWDLDPFSNPNSHIVSAERCMLEDGGDGFGDRSAAGVYRLATGEIKAATSSTRVWGQPPYSIVLEALAHYGHTRFCFLLRFDPRTKWFKQLYALSGLVCVARKMEFEPPPGVKSGANPIAHALFYRNPEDATAAVLRKSAAAWRTR